MRFLAIGLAAALAFAGLSPVAASAQGYGAQASQAAPAAAAPTAKEKKAAAAAANTPDAKNKAKGMTEAPPLLTAAGYTCTPADATYLGVSKAKNDKGKEVTTTVYEVACQAGFGYLVMSKPEEPTEVYDCLKLQAAKDAGGKNPTCTLPANTDFTPVLQSYITKAGDRCTVNKVRFFGSNSTTKVDDYEVACSEGGAYIVVVPQPGSTKALATESCIIASREGVACQFLPKESIVAQIKALAAPANRTACQVSDATYVGQSPTNKHTFYEVGCADGKSGFMLEVDAANKYVGAIDCARASAVAGGCKLTTVSEGDTSDNAIYAKLAKEIGFDCNVTSYRSMGMDSATNREIVELACSNHPAGAIAFMPTSKGQKGEWVNCLRAEGRGYKCGMSKPELAYAEITKSLTAKGKECPVNGARGMGGTAAGEDFVEVSCSTGGGLVIKYAAGGSDAIDDVMACVQAKGINGGCKLQK